MRKFTTSLFSFILAAVLYALQQTAKLFRAPSEIVDPKNPPAPGFTGEKPRSPASYLYRGARRLFELFGDPAAVIFLALDELQCKLVDLIFDPYAGKLRVWRMLPRNLMHQCVLAVAAVGGQRAPNIQEAKNTRYIFLIVRNNPEKLGIPKAGEFDLALC
jgi:hypothetical protein